MKEPITLDTLIEKIPHVGIRSAPKLKKLGIATVRDLLYHFPSRYEDFRETRAIADVKEVGEVVSVRGVVIRNSSTIGYFRRRLAITNIVVEDETGTLRVVWFGQPYIEKQLPIGTAVSLAGKVSRDAKGLYLTNPAYEKQQLTVEDLRHTGRYVPKYPETEGVTSKYIRFLIQPILKEIKNIADPLPEDILDRNDLPSLADALKGMHFPELLPEAEKARERFAIEELIMFQIRALLDRKHLQSLNAPRLTFDADAVAKFVKNLPYQLTDDQRVAAFEILQDLDKDYPMNRLLNGDVGSGKTAVALVSAYQVALSSHISVLMAPTEILARQHFDTARLLYKNTKLKVALLTGSEARQFPIDEITEEKVTKKMMQDKIAEGEFDIIIGTHAVIQKDVKIPRLGLVIIDEQHRFGVSQRMQLLKGRGEKRAIPHLLSMTATPIPRTLAMTIYGDLDVSLIKQKPKGRQKIITKVVSAEERKKAYKFVDEQIKKGRQVFVICPRIDVQEKEDEEGAKKQSLTQLMWSEVRAVTEEYQNLSTKIFPQHRVVMLHGKMRPVEKDAIMRDFKDGKYDILVSTSVIEVGVDVPNASLMIIESSDRFGLAQLHQFRGRVGRGEHQSYCLLFTTSDQEASQRLKSLEEIDSGFELAEMDMKLRGPGEFTGVKQSGMPDLVMASLANVELIQKARNEAKFLLNKDPSLEKYPLIKKRVELAVKTIHYE